MRDTSKQTSLEVFKKEYYSKTQVLRQFLQHEHLRLNWSQRNWSERNYVYLVLQLLPNAHCTYFLDLWARGLYVDLRSSRSFQMRGANERASERERKHKEKRGGGGAVGSGCIENWSNSSQAYIYNIIKTRTLTWWLSWAAWTDFWIYNWIGTRFIVLQSFCEHNCYSVFTETKLQFCSSVKQLNF